MTARNETATAAGELRCRALNEAEQYAIGFAEGFEAGYAAAHAEVAGWWAQLAARIRADAHRWSPYAERRRRELEWAKPKPGDFTGRLSPAEYFTGTEYAEAA